MRARLLKPGFFTNDSLAEVQPLGRLLFAGLWLLADREGRLADRPKSIKGQLLPFDRVSVEPLLAKLSEQGFIYRYKNPSTGEALIQILAFSKHQSPHVKEPASTMPAPVEHHASPAVAVAVAVAVIDPETVAVAVAEGSDGWLFKLYEQRIGTLDDHMKVKLLEAVDEHHEVCIRRAFGKASEANVRRWGYVARVLEDCTACTKEQCFGGARRSGTDAPVGVDIYAADEAFLAERRMAAKGS